MRRWRNGKNGFIGGLAHLPSLDLPAAEMRGGTGRRADYPFIGPVGGAVLTAAPMETKRGLAHWLGAFDTGKAGGAGEHAVNIRGLIAGYRLMPGLGNISSLSDGLCCGESL